MPCDGTRTGRTLAKRSSSRRMATLADSMFGQGSPRWGVVVGPLSTAWHLCSSATTSSGRALPWAARFSIVSPSMSLNSILPLATSGARMPSSTRTASRVMKGPMPSPPQTPMIPGGLFGVGEPVGLVLEQLDPPQLLLDDLGEVLLRSRDGGLVDHDALAFPYIDGLVRI